MTENAQDTAQTRTLLPDARRHAIAERLRATGSISVAELEGLFGVSSMTARRDLADLERQGLAQRTHGGAVLPSIAGHEDSFASRMEIAGDAKRALGRAAAALVGEHEAVFLDSSSTGYHVARALLDRGIAATVITNSLPIMELVGTHPVAGVDLIGVGGQLRRLTSSFVGPHAVATVAGHLADRVFFSVKGLTPDGSLTDADPFEAEVKRAMVAHAGGATLLVDRTKLSARGLAVIAKVGDLQGVLSHGLRDEERAALEGHGVEVEAVDAR